MEGAERLRTVLAGVAHRAATNGKWPCFGYYDLSAGTTEGLRVTNANAGTIQGNVAMVDAVGDSREPGTMTQ